TKLTSSSLPASKSALNCAPSSPSGTLRSSRRSPLSAMRQRFEFHRNIKHTPFSEIFDFLSSRAEPGLLANITAAKEYTRLNITVLLYKTTQEPQQARRLKHVTIYR
ncbi:hypothetical protein C0J52_23724, partial [Blattella germanica]